MGFFPFPNPRKSAKDSKIFTVTDTSHRSALTQSLTVSIGYHQRLRQIRCAHSFSAGNTKCVNAINGNIKTGSK